MLDIQAIVKDPDLFTENCRRRGVKFDIQELLHAYAERNQWVRQLQLIREEQNEIASKMKQKDLSQETRASLIAKGREIKANSIELEASAEQATSHYESLLMKLPNLTHPEVPEGGEADFKLIKKWGQPKTFSFPVLDHLQLAHLHKLVDFEMGARVAGQKFYFLKNEALFLELALVRYALDIATKHGYQVMSTPDVAKNSVLEGIGFAPKGPESQIYRLEDHDMSLIATSEITIGGGYESQVLELQELPVLIAGLSHCFRTESGSHGRESKGLYRVHQFTKVELFAFTHPQASQDQHDKILAIEEEIYQGLELAYRVIDVASGDLGAPAYRKFDMEAWIPSRGEKGDYGEVTSTSNCLDFQSRRLKIRYRDESGKLDYVHTLNGTAIASARTILAILENGQQEDGSILMPKALHPYLPFTQIG